MKSFFNKLTTGGPSPPKGKLDDKHFAAQLEKATSTVTQLSQLRQANFPLLNEVGFAVFASCSAVVSTQSVMTQNPMLCRLHAQVSTSTQQLAAASSLILVSMVYACRTLAYEPLQAAGLITCSYPVS